jgi:hypothetical protein
MQQKRILILVENLPSPFDRRVWQEAGTLRDAGYGVSIICPTGKGCEKKHELVDGIDIWRYDCRRRAPARSATSWSTRGALLHFLLTFKVLVKQGFDVIHACNPPDLFFLIGGFFKLFGKKFVFDHHDANPELYEAKFGRRDLSGSSCSGWNGSPSARRTSRSPPTTRTGASRSSAAAWIRTRCS